MAVTERYLEYSDAACKFVTLLATCAKIFRVSIFFMACFGDNGLNCNRVSDVAHFSVLLDLKLAKHIDIFQHKFFFRQEDKR